MFETEVLNPMLISAAKNSWACFSTLMQDFSSVFVFQALVKVNNAIHGVNNARFDDLAHMIAFTHTGDLGHSQN